MAETPLPAEAGVPLSFLRGRGILTGMDGALNPDAKNAAAQAAAMYRHMDDTYRERVDALVRADGRVPVKAVHLLYQEWMSRQKAPKDSVPMGVRGSIQNILRDTIESDLA